MTYDYFANTPEAAAKRLERAQLRHQQQPDPLRERVRLYQLWHESARYWPAFNTHTPVSSVYRQPGLRRRAALPSVRQHLQAKADHRKAMHAAARREAAEQNAQAAALAKAGPMPLFEGMPA